MAKALARPEKESYVLVDFRHGTNALENEKYTDWTVDFEGYTSTPDMEVNLPANTGTFDSKELRITMPTDAFTERAASGAPHSPIFVTVQEVTQGLFAGDVGSQLTVFRGRVMRTVKDPRGLWLSSSCQRSSVLMYPSG